MPLPPTGQGEGAAIVALAYDDEVSLRWQSHAAIANMHELSVSAVEKSAARGLQLTHYELFIYV